MALLDRQNRHLSKRIEECRENLERVDAIKQLVFKNTGQYGPEELQRTIDETAKAMSDLTSAELLYQEATERRAEARERIGWLRHDLELAHEVAHDADIHSPAEEAVTFRNASRQVFQI